MRNKRLLRTLSAFCLTMVVAFGFTIPAFAQGSEQAPAAPAEDSTNDSNVIVEAPEPAPALTPEGHVALVDVLGGNKQLITCLLYTSPQVPSRERFCCGVPEEKWQSW